MPARILAVDDIESNLVALEALLQDPDVAVVRARSGREALQAMGGGEFSLVLMDVQMPEMDGFDTAAAIRKLGAAHPVPIIFVTAHGSTKEKLAKAYSVGASDFVEKPIDPVALRAKVRAIVDLWQRAHEAEERHREEMVAAAAAEHRARLEAERANRLKDEFLATLSHELRTPLNAILGWAGLIAKRSGDAAAVTRGVEVISRNGRSLAKLIDDMLDVSRIVAGKLRLDVQPVQTAAVVERAVESFRPAAEQKNVALAFGADRDVPPLPGDPERLRQVVTNLLSNAVKFTPSGGRVDVRVACVGSRVRVRVTDTGVGIAPEFLPHVFERFRQGDAAPTRAHGGLGIGLSLARHLVDLHGGEITAESEGVGRGATFTVILPVPAVSAPAADAPADAARARAVSLAGVRVLVVDDERDARDLTREVLEHAGAMVQTVATATLALDAVTSPAKPDVIVSDIGMPETDGCDLLRGIRAMPRERGGQIPAVALTAYASGDNAERARRAGFQAFLRKPVDAGELVAKVAELAGARPDRRDAAAER